MTKKSAKIIPLEPASSSQTESVNGNLKKKDIVLGGGTRLISVNSEAILMDKISKSKGDGYVLDTTKAKEIIWDGREYKFFKKARCIDDVIFQKGFFLFGLVRNSALKYIKDNNGVIPKVEKYDVNFTNLNFDIENKAIVGIDLTAAYWHIAYNLNVINEATFKRGMVPMDIDYKEEHKSGDLLKPIRLSALSVLGKQKKYSEIKDGKETGKTIMIGGHPLLEETYRMIRYTCYLYMHTAMEILGMDEFLTWRTDCIYFHNTRANIKKVRDYFDSVNMDYKILTKPKGDMK